MAIVDIGPALGPPALGTTLVECMAGSQLVEPTFLVRGTLSLHGGSCSLFHWLGYWILFPHMLG
jgi:hypothetical protein